MGNLNFVNPAAAVCGASYQPSKTPHDVLLRLPKELFKSPSNFDWLHHTLQGVATFVQSCLCSLRLLDMQIQQLTTCNRSWGTRQETLALQHPIPGLSIGIAKSKRLDRITMAINVEYN